MKKLLFMTLISLPIFLSAYDTEMINMGTPSSFDAGEMSLQINHKFLGEVNNKDSDSKTGMEQGAMVDLHLKGVVFDHIMLQSSYNPFYKEKTIGGSYNLLLPSIFLKASAGGNYFVYEKSDLKEKRKNGFYFLNLQSMPILERVSAAASGGYDGYNKHFGTAFGLYITIFENFHLLGEYFPQIDSNSSNKNIGKKDYFAAGIKIDTWGHHFIFSLGNSYDINDRHLMLGADNKKLYLGIKIERKIDIFNYMGGRK